MVEPILERFTEIRNAPYESLAEWKKRTGKQIICSYPMWVPEEIIHAADLLPVVAWDSSESITLGQSYVRSFNCGLTRSFVDDMVTGRLDFIDGMVFPDTCLQARGLPFIAEKHVKLSFLAMLCMPLVIPNSTTRPHLLEVLQTFKGRLEAFTGQKITDKALKESIQIYNRNRQMLRKVYELRKRRPGSLRANEIISIVRAGMSMPKEEHTEQLEELLRELERRPAAPGGKVRVILSGQMCWAAPVDVVNLVEETGMVVVDDDLYVGSRYFANDASTQGDPLEALADRFLARIPPCPTKVDWETEWADYLKEMMAETGAQGIITLLPKFCPPQLCYYPDVKRPLAEAGIREIVLETAHEAVSLEPLRTRLQAFVETIRR